MNTKPGAAAAAMLMIVVLTVFATPVLAAAEQQAKTPNPTDIASGQTSAARVVLGFLLYVVGPIVGAYGIIRGAATIIQRHEVDKGLASMAAGAVVGLVPHMLNAFYGVDLAKSASDLFKWTGN